MTDSDKHDIIKEFIEWCHKNGAELMVESKFSGGFDSDLERANVENLIRFFLANEPSQKESK